MSNNDNKSKASLLDVVSFLVLIFLGAFAIGAIFSEEYSVPIWVYIVIGLAIFHIYKSSQRDKKSSYTTSHSPYRKSEYEPTKNHYHKSNYQPGEEVETNIVGVTFEGRQTVIARLKIGDDIVLEREYDNPHDPNAIKVLAYRYTKDEQEKLMQDVSENYDTKIESNSDLSHNLFLAKMQLMMSSPETQEVENKIVEINTSISQLDEERKELEKERRELSIKQCENVQAGYINKELANLIAPIFDRWASGPVTKVDGKVIQLTGREKPDLYKGAIIRFRLPDEAFLRNAINLENLIYF